MLTVPQAARVTDRDPETVRRWIRSGKLPAHKVGTQHVVEENHLQELLDAGESWSLPMPVPWQTLPSGARAPDWVRLLDETRRGR